MLSTNDGNGSVFTYERENAALRRLLWSSHPCASKYGDDGELQCAICHIDFKRDTVEQIYQRLFETTAVQFQKSPNDGLTEFQAYCRKYPNNPVLGLYVWPAYHSDGSFNISLSPPRNERNISTESRDLNKGIAYVVEQARLRETQTCGKK